MKKSLLTLGAVAAFAASACAQGEINVTGLLGINTASSSSTASSGWYTGSATLEIFTIDAAGNSALASEINADETSLSSVVAGVTLITGLGSGWTQQEISPIASPTAAEALSQTEAVNGGGFSSQGGTEVGTSASLPETTDIFYAFVLTEGNDEGAVILDTPSGGYLPSTSPENAMNSEYPADGQNVLLAPVPEPTTLALAGLGGLSMLFLRRRKS